MKEKDFTIGYVGEAFVGDELKIPTKNIPGINLQRKSVIDDKIVNPITGTGYVGQAELRYEEVIVTVTTGNLSGTGTATSGSIIIGYRPSGNVDQLVDSIAISGTTVTVTLAANATANNNFVVILLKV